MAGVTTFCQLNILGVQQTTQNLMARFDWLIVSCQLLLAPSSYIERDKQQRQNSEFSHTANLPSSLTEERFSEIGSKILPLTEFLNQRLVLKLYQLTSCPYLGTTSTICLLTTGVGLNYICHCYRQPPRDYGAPSKHLPEQCFGQSS